ncbi:MAG: site-specific integrase [Bradyrhizobium sp.]|uniref:tyrosine-type recombinase/integrase n=1 Tax=Bradyrhizobium sp. TaxID=376 RepID=UPI0011FEA0FE|nr:tyrosine-type recombinase/integrase [Bradyrhizobium sp.]THD71886.1 MAG: site-specific integrase [Bradyrhizobium sp.]
MKGHIRERSPGHWAIIIDLRDPETGKRRRKWHSFHGPKREAQVECARLISEMTGGTYLEPGKTTVAQFLERWLDHAKSQVSPRTHERYCEIVRKNIVPALGAVFLTKLRPAQISAVYSRALTSGRRDGKGGLAPSTVVYMHRLIKQALGQAVRWELLARNAADAVDPPKVERGTLTTYDMTQTVKLLEELRESRLRLPVLLGVMCGLRRGEIVALRWGHIDLAAGKMMVVESAEQTAAGIRYKPPKSGRGRTVALSATVTAELRQHRLAQAEELLGLGVRQSDTTFVYTRQDGEPMQPRSLSQMWSTITTALPRIRFHDLRHAHATHMLAAGVHPKVASERLGHSRVGITLDLYSHVLPGMQEDAAARVDEAYQIAEKKRAENIG